MFAAGNDIKLSGVFINVKGRRFDPDTVKLRVKDPDGTQVEYTYGTDPGMCRDSVGSFYFIQRAVTPGTWSYQFRSTLDTTNGSGAEEKRFVVRATDF